MHISLPDQLNQYVQSKMASGLYRNESELISEALRQKIVSERTEDPALETLRHEIMIGWNEAERGECTPLDIEALKRDLDAEYNG